MILALDFSDLPTDAIVIFAMLVVSFLGWLKNKFFDKPEEVEPPEDDPMREIIWRRQMGENSEETRMPWEEPEVAQPTIRFDPPPMPQREAAPPPPPLPVTEVSAREEDLANAFERTTRRRRSDRTGHRRMIDRFLRTPSAAKDAIVLTEILGRPLALKADTRTEP